MTVGIRLNTGPASIPARTRRITLAFLVEPIKADLGMTDMQVGLPIHVGRPVRVEGEASFTQFVAVYYPVIDHMHAMIGSTFMTRIGSGKQPGDSLAVATVPVLSRL